MKKKLFALTVTLAACSAPAVAATSADQPAPAYCQLLTKAGFGPLTWDERIGGCNGRRPWGAANIEVAHYVYRIDASKNILQAVTLLAKPGRARAREGREALAAAAVEAASVLGGDSVAIVKAVKAGRETTFKLPGWKVDVSAKDPDMLKVKFWSQAALDADCAELRTMHPKAKCD